MRLVDADALLDRIPNLYERREVSRWVDDALTVDAVPVVRGEWIEENTRPRSGVFYCSSCHRTCYDIQPTRLKGWTKRCRYAFCPNCGADMRKDGEHPIKTNGMRFREVFGFDIDALYSVSDATIKWLNAEYKEGPDDN